MLSNNHPSNTQENDHTLPPSPPLSPTTITHSPSPITTDPIKIIKLNCCNKSETTHKLLNLIDVDILLLQEPWINTHSSRPPPYHMWYNITPYDYTPPRIKPYLERVFIYQNDTPQKNTLILPSGSTFITDIELQTEDPNMPSLRVMLFSNRPTKN